MFTAKSQGLRKRILVAAFIFGSAFMTVATFSRGNDILLLVGWAGAGICVHVALFLAVVNLWRRVHVVRDENDLRRIQLRPHEVDS